jgi:hypothetical protein
MQQMLKYQYFHLLILNHFLFSSSNITFEFRAEIKDDEWYSLLILNFYLTGGDQYIWLKDPEYTQVIVSTGITYTQAAIDYVVNKTEVSSIYRGSIIVCKCGYVS